MQNIDVTQLTVETDVRNALKEDIGDGDVTAQLIPQEQISNATVITRETAIICGVLWFNEVFRQLDPNNVIIKWNVEDGDRVHANDILCTLKGPSRILLTGERTALNFVQLLSGVSTQCRSYADLVEGTNVKIRDTRKTIPGLRLAEKYAVRKGGCYNHRFGLYDQFLIKENHIAACDNNIEKVVKCAREISSNKPIEIEVENLDELKQALNTNVDVILLDNMSLDDMRQAVQITNGRVPLEASGNVNEKTVRAVAETGVDFVAIGSLTKNINAIDLSMRFQS
jgi:nicotinate-nucleotide pyrophosphorylase (carboxylating)